MDLTAMPFLRAQMSRGWADTARVFWLCAKATNPSVSRLLVLVPEYVTCFKVSLENAAQILYIIKKRLFSFVRQKLVS